MAPSTTRRYVRDTPRDRGRAVTRTWRVAFLGTATCIQSIRSSESDRQTSLDAGEGGLEAGVHPVQREAGKDTCESGA